MKKYFRTLQSVLDSRWGNFQYAGTSAAQKTDRILQSSKLEDCIYRDLSRDDENLEVIQQKAASKLHSFPALSRDVFQSVYSLFPKRTDADRLTAEAQKFNAKLLDHVTEDADYPTIKSICEGRELPAYEAASEFTAKIGAQLDGLLSELGGEDGTLKTLEKLQATRNQAQQKLTELLEQMRNSVQNPTLEQAVIDAANQAESKTQQAEAVAKMVDTTARQNKAAISERVSAAVGAAAEKAKEVQTILGAWSDDAGTMEKNAVTSDYNKYLTDLNQYNTDRDFDYGAWLDRYNMLGNNLQAGLNMDAQELERYLAELQQYNTDRDFYYGQLLDEINDQTNDFGTLVDMAQLAAGYGDYRGLENLGIQLPTPSGYAGAGAGSSAGYDDEAGNPPGATDERISSEAMNILNAYMHVNPGTNSNVGQVFANRINSALSAGRISQEEADYLREMIGIAA